MTNEQKGTFYVVGMAIAGIAVGFLTHSIPTGFLFIGLSLMVAPIIDKLTQTNAD